MFLFFVRYALEIFALIDIKKYIYLALKRHAELDSASAVVKAHFSSKSKNPESRSG